MSTATPPAPPAAAPPDATTDDAIPFRALLPLLLITFAVAWGVLGAYVLWPDAMAGTFGALSGTHPLFYLAVYAPAIGALAVVLRWSGPAGVGRFLGRLGRWRCAWPWYLFLLVGVPLVFFAGAALKGGAPEAGAGFETWSAAVVACLAMLVKGPVEELGWRGVALPLLQRRFTPLLAGILVGLVWAVWHLPAFLLSGTPQSAWALTPFLLGTVALSVIVTPLFNASGGSLLLPALFHFQLINPLWPDAQPYDTYLFIAVAAVVVLLHRRRMFRRAGAVTRVVPASP